MSLRQLDLNLLVSLDALLTTGSVTGAARQLGVTQPAASRALSRLREALGDPVLVQVGRRMQPTARMARLEPKLAEALRATRAVFEPAAAFQPADATGEVRIAMGDEAQATFAQALLSTFATRSPRIDVRFRRLAVESLSEGKRGVIDLAVAPDLSTLPPVAGGVSYAGFVTEPLFTRRFVVTSSPKMPRRRFTLASYAAARHLLVGPEGSGRGFVDDFLESQGYTRRVAATVTSFLVAPHIVAQSDLICTLPLEIVRSSPVRLVAAVPPLALPPLPMVMIWHPRDTDDARHAFVRGVVRDAVRRRVAQLGLDTHRPERAAAEPRVAPRR